MLWLVLAGLLVLHLDSEGAFGDRPDAPLAQANHVSPSPLAEPAPPPTAERDPAASGDLTDSGDPEDEPTANATTDATQSGGASGDAPGTTGVSGAEAVAKPAARPVPRPSAPTSPLAHPSLQNAYDEPIMNELAAFFDAIHEGLERPGAAIDPELSIYVDQLVTRMNAEGQPYVVRLNHPNLEVVRRRAVRGHALLVEAGLRPWLLEVFGERGGTGVSVERG